ncbi:unnamed protein product [Periconia digitata]|uniref:L-lysine 2,3-aminomutase n=1 Tax=Periconia digitata TaxID=1303443 RepID=A0A9W4UV59_9PLEO|nr:unnamed protein product [Periconia digitata]
MYCSRQPFSLGKIKRVSCLQFHSGNSVNKLSLILTPRRLVHTHLTHRHAFWKQIPAWSDVSEGSFLSYDWQANNSVHNAHQLSGFMNAVLPEFLPRRDQLTRDPRTAKELIQDVQDGMRRAPMAVKLTPYILSLIDWTDPLRDPLLRQYVPLGSRFRPDHPKLAFDSLDETGDSPVKGIIHRYPDKAVFMASSVCPVYCRYCTRSYSVGVDTNAVNKTRFLPIHKKWDIMFDYIERTSTLKDILVSGGDTYTLSSDQLKLIGERLLKIPHILRVRIASKGVAICPSRLIDPNDNWASSLIDLSRQARKMGKSVALHTHFNSPNEITWITKKAAQRLHEEAVVVRNQTVLLNGVNNNVETMKSLIHQLASMNIQPYYVFQSDMVRGIEDMRTPLHEILRLEAEIRGSTAGFMTPNFVVNLPGGGMKRLACSYNTYDRGTGRSTFVSPGSKDPGREWEYWDPIFPQSEAEQTTPGQAISVQLSEQQQGG